MKGRVSEKVLTPMKAIRAKCLDCSCYQPKEVRLCPVPSVHCGHTGWGSVSRGKPKEPTPLSGRQLMRGLAKVNVKHEVWASIFQ